MANPPLIIDIYHGDNSSVPWPIDFDAVKAAGYIGVIHKATEGSNPAADDPLYATRRKAATAASLLWGAYAFFHGTDAIAEADHFLEVAQPDAETLVALDWENWPDETAAPSAAAARAFCQRVYDKLGRWPVLYSGNVAKEQIQGHDPFFAKLKLWLCEYSETWKVQESWTSPWLWQANADGDGPGPHIVPGIQGVVDNNCVVAPMTAERLRAEWAT